MSGNVLILGCGPSGLLAAHAVEQLGGEPVIVSVKVRSRFQGAQYLHVPISGLTGDPDGVIYTHKSGSKAGYAKKVYGDPRAKCSWDLQPEEREAWDLRALYDRLWQRFQSRIVDRKLDWDDLNDICERVRDGHYALAISTLPAIQSCHQKRERCGDHEFQWESMWTIDFAPPEVADNTVLYSGDLDCDWYRSSRVFGHACTEFSNHRPITGGAYLTPEEIKPAQIFTPKKGIKVQGSNCNCWSDIKRVGRFGTWRQGYLTHHAYHDAARLYEEATA